MALCKSNAAFHEEKNNKKKQAHVHRCVQLPFLLTTLCERSGALASPSSVFVFGYSKSLEVRAHNVSVRSRAARTHAGCGLASSRWNKQESPREKKKDEEEEEGRGRNGWQKLVCFPMQRAPAHVRTIPALCTGNTLSASSLRPNMQPP